MEFSLIYALLMHCLHPDEAADASSDCSTYLVIFEVAVEILARAELHHGRKGVDIDLSGVQQRHFALMARALVHSGHASAA